MKKRNLAWLLVLPFLIGSTACSSKQETTVDRSENEYPDCHVIDLSSVSATCDGNAISEYDYTWHCDPSTNHDEVGDAPAEYYTGSLPDELPDVYVDHELYYYPELDAAGFELVNYDGENEYAYYYQDGIHDDYIFATLPSLGNSIPTDMMHSEAAANENKVLHITVAGTYILQGNWKGQINIDLGDTDEVFGDASKSVTLVLSGCNIECTVAPGVIFRDVYECDHSWEARENADTNPDLSDAGAVVIIADGTSNTITGYNVFRMLKTKYKDEESEDEIKTQKKLRKTDGALYSYMSMVIKGEDENTGVLTVNSGYEGVDSELHMEVAGGKLMINSQDDGMNVNEDNVSVMKFTGGEVEIYAALGAEGDGVDSNGYVRIEGGLIRVNGIRVPDSSIDSEDGIYYIDGSIVINGTVEKHENGDVFRETGNSNNAPGDFRPGENQLGEIPSGEFPGDPPEGERPNPIPNGDFPGEPPEGGFPNDRPNERNEDESVGD
ncbi:MAG: carbohydrate-binding domain-containing protein [Clostridiales bacterium]|nr:carbohydrate-binding domain-containing protein [Candidatus Scatonaster coprocaballi]